ncbi:MAG: hypothetical protein IPG61_15425 [bacterium]|nr:hypothetical protein [bacterium]
MQTMGAQHRLRFTPLLCALALGVLLGGTPPAGATVVSWGAAVVAGREELADLRAVSAGGYHTLGLRPDSTLVATGYNWFGQATPPVAVRGLVAVSAGYLHSLALDAAGTVHAWGANEHGQGTAPQVSNGQGANTGHTAIAAGGYHNLVLGAAGGVTAWGRDDFAQCSSAPAEGGFSAVAAGGFHSLALRADGTIAAWGRNDDGQCDVPVPNTGFVAIAAGWKHSLALRADGSVAAWGAPMSDSSSCRRRTRASSPSPRASTTAWRCGPTVRSRPGGATTTGRACRFLPTRSTRR